MTSETAEPVDPFPGMKFGTILVDPPWNYKRPSKSERLTGYSSGVEYEPLTTPDLAALPVGDYAADNGILILWTTWPFLDDALWIIGQWGYQYITGLPWLKVTRNEKLIYGVGYWMRGVSEVVLIAKRPGAPSVRSNFIGLLSQSLSHSRKPVNIYELANTYPEPRLELFARELQPGWVGLGDELPGDERDIRASLIPRRT